MASKYDNRYYQEVGVIKSHYVYKAIWMPTIGEKLSVQFEKNNKHVVALIKDNQIVGQIRLVAIISLLRLRFTFNGENRATPLAFIRVPVFTW